MNNGKKLDENELSNVINGHQNKKIRTAPPSDKKKNEQLTRPRVDFDLISSYFSNCFFIHSL